MTAIPGLRAIVPYGTYAEFAPASDRAPSWRERAKCWGVALGQDHDPWWDPNVTKAQAALLCAGCEVKNECVEDARTNGGAGVCGGLVEAEWRR